MGKREKRERRLDPSSTVIRVGSPEGKGLICGPTVKKMGRLEEGGFSESGAVRGKKKKKSGLGGRRKGAHGGTNQRRPVLPARGVVPGRKMRVPLSLLRNARGKRKGKMLNGQNFSREKKKTKEEGGKE